jgi:hypothetical protein
MALIWELLGCMEWWRIRLAGGRGRLGFVWHWAPSGEALSL